MMQQLDQLKKGSVLMVSTELFNGKFSLFSQGLTAFGVKDREGGGGRKGGQVQFMFINVLNRIHE